jgi:hypothetical protein
MASITEENKLKEVPIQSKIPKETINAQKQNTSLRP